MPLLASGVKAPPFSLTAVVSDRAVTLQNSAERMLLMFHGYQTSRLVGEVVKGVRGSYPDAERLLVASVPDLSFLPRLMHPIANKIMRDAYQEAAALVPESEDPADHILILPDWKGSAFAAYQVPKSSEDVALVLIDQARRIQGTYVGGEPVGAALALLNGSGG